MCRRTAHDRVFFFLEHLASKSLSMYLRFPATVTDALSVTTSLASTYFILHLYSCAGLVLRQRREAKVWLHDAEVREQFLGQIVCSPVSHVQNWSKKGRRTVYAGVNNHIITWNPVDWRSDSVLISSL